MLTTSDCRLLGIAPCHLARANSQSSSSNYLAGTGGPVLVPRISRQLTSAGGACGSRAGVPDAIAASAARGLASAAAVAGDRSPSSTRTNSGGALHPGQGRSSSRLARREDMQAWQSQPGSRRGDPANDEIASDSVTYDRIHTATTATPNTIITWPADLYAISRQRAYPFCTFHLDHHSTRSYVGSSSLLTNFDRMNGEDL